nr:PREDICTED: carbohydrate-responsive element-binding protein-like isoform X2 [Lepisosteus oculatus]
MAKAERLGSAGFSGRTKHDQIPDSESDSDPEEEHGVNAGAGQATGAVSRTQVIHSGHFMVSAPHSDSTPRRGKRGSPAGYDFDTVNRTWCHTYSFGPRSSGSLSIDPTLTRLFECMTLAYSGKLVSPKWKSFKGLRLLWRDKIRLNNGIWRAWYIQYVEKRRNPVCGFVTPLEGSEAEAHRKPEAIVLEGSYWKRRIEVVIKEYHKWRIYHKKRLQKNKNGRLSMLDKRGVYRKGVSKWPCQMFPEPVRMQEESHMFDLDCFLSDISDTLFTMTQKSCPWAGDRHDAYTSNADMIQPGLTPLQPNLDDFMDIPDIFMSYRSQPVEQTGFSESEYFGSVAGSMFSSGPALGTAEPLLPGNNQLVQANVVPEERLILPPSSNVLSDTGYHRQSLSPKVPYNHSGMTSDPKYKAEVDYNRQSEYHPPELSAATSPYGNKHYTSTTTAVPPSMGSLIQDTMPYGSFSAPCQKYRYTSPITSSVITHTGSMSTVLPEDTPGHVYPAPETFSQVPVSYPPLFGTQTTVPSLAMHHNFSVPQRMAVGCGGTSAGKSKIPVPPASPLQSSCLAKLLSTGTQECKPTVGFELPRGEVKCKMSTSPSSPPSGGVYSSCGTNMRTSPSLMGAPAVMQQSLSQALEIPLLPALHSHMPQFSPGIQNASSSQSSTVSALLMQNNMPTSTPLLVPKTEKLSPIQIYNEKTALTVNFRRNSGQISPTNPPEKSPSPQSPHSNPSQTRPEQNKIETRRITHISAEQKRRFNIKLGFDTLHSLVTTLSSQPSIKISKATTLQKTAEYISKMQQERAQLHEEAQRLREEVVALNCAINECQQQLPATGVPITRQRFDHMREMFRDYVRAQTLQNWKFWIFSIIIEPLFETYNGMVSTASVEDLCRTTLSWLDQYCSLPALRPTVLRSLRHLCTSTSILTDPTLVPEQATQAVTQTGPGNSYP